MFLDLNVRSRVLGYTDLGRLVRSTGLQCLLDQAAGLGSVHQLGQSSFLLFPGLGRSDEEALNAKAAASLPSVVASQSSFAAVHHHPGMGFGMLMGVVSEAELAVARLGQVKRSGGKVHQRWWSEVVAFGGSS
ncbi:hypothetical protein V6N13_061520 [Hibiscus sabdariffa]